MKKHIYIISDQRPGHVNQSQGLLLPLQTKGIDVDVIILPSPRSSLKRFFLILAKLFSRFPSILFRIYMLYYRTRPPSISDASLFVSTGGDTLVANIILSRLTLTPNIFIGKRSRHTDHGVRLLITTVGSPVQDKVVVTDFAPVNVQPLSTQTDSRQYKLIAVLLGGDSNEYSYTDEDFDCLANSLNTLCQRNNAKLLLTTSRRTGTIGDRLLQEKIESVFLEDVTWYSENPSPTAASYCNRADIIFCSEDSGTMLTESISYGKPVVSFSPKKKETTAFYEKFLKKIRRYNVIMTDISSLSAVDVEKIPAAEKPDLTAATAAITALLN